MLIENVQHPRRLQNQSHARQPIGQIAKINAFSDRIRNEVVGKRVSTGPHAVTYDHAHYKILQSRFVMLATHSVGCYVSLGTWYLFGIQPNIRRYESMATTTRNLKFFVLFILCAAFAPMSAANAQSPFKNLAGTWSGSGSVKLANGKSEKLRCKAYYTRKSGGKGLGMAIRCASAANKFSLRANMTYAGGSVSGNWSETNFNASGGLSGKASANRISVAIRGGISGSMSVSVNGKSQRVSLSTKGQSAFRGVNISFRKRG